MAKSLNTSRNEISVSHKRVKEESSLPECDDVSCGKYLTALDLGLRRS